MDKREPVTIIIPTMDNLDQLWACLQSLYMGFYYYPFKIIVVNNGQIPIADYLPEHMKTLVTVLNPGTNLGWTGGLRLGVENSTSKYVLFANDDIFLPRASVKCIKELVRILDIYDEVGAVGPTSNVVMGMQNIWNDLPCKDYAVQFLIGFFMLVRRKALEEAGGVQDMEYGGDDIDLSIRLRKAGYLLYCRREEFVYHHGFQTGRRMHGDENAPNGWNSREMTDNTNMELIRKHGFLEWWETFYGKKEAPGKRVKDDAEGEIIRNQVNGGPVVELGCGGSGPADRRGGLFRRGGGGAAYRQR